jgi:hypothetical protein
MFFGEILVLFEQKMIQKKHKICAQVIDLELHPLVHKS